MEFMDVVHGVLDVAGFIPVVGAAADVANAAIYAAEGDWGNAALSMVSAVPGVGDVAGAAGKVVKVAAKGASKAKKAGNAVSKTKKMTSFLAKVSGKAKTGAKKIQDQINRMIEMLKQKRNGKKNGSDDKCFTGDTLVCTKFGLQPIKEVRKGDDIYSRNEKNGKTGLRRIEKVIQTEAHTIYHIWVDGQEKIKTTAYHPFFVKDQGWTNTINLKEGDQLEANNGEVKITRLVKMRYDEPVKVYNFCVEEWETYFVSEKQVYVHNCSYASNKTQEIHNPVLDNPRTGKAQKGDAHHSFNDIVDNYAGDAKEFSIVGKDGRERSLYQLEGALNGKDGVFEWIVDPDPTKGVTHRRFIPGVGITGRPNAKP